MRCTLAGPVGLLALLLAPSARAELGDTGTRLALHAEGGAARSVGQEKADQFGWGGAGLVAAELRLGRYVGVELDAGWLALANGTVDDPRYAPTAMGTAFLVGPGVRLRPFGGSHDPAARGMWLAAGGGLAFTGPLSRLALDARAGYDFSLASVEIGPYAGLVQIIEPSGGLRPNDATIVMFGVHAAFEPAPAPPPPAAPRARPPAPAIEAPAEVAATPAPPCQADPGGKGCPQADADRDRVIDTDDRCASDPEDRDGFEDEDGCPDPDDDRDGVLDAADRCPLEAETVNGYADDDGCPDATSVRVDGDRIELDENVEFDVGSAVVGFKSRPMLARLARLMNEHTGYALVHVMGHADDSGDMAYNLALSEARARAVVAILVAGGVANERFTVEAFGDALPRAVGCDARAKRANRRVELTIVKRTSAAADKGGAR